MPRRIGDYPDAYMDWNLIATLGSYISLISTFFFFFIIYITLIKGKSCINNPWNFSKEENIQGSTSLEWVVTSPPAYHTFNEIPVVKKTLQKVIIQ